MELFNLVWSYLKDVWEVFTSHTWVFYPIIAVTIALWELIQFILRKTFKTIIRLLKWVLLPFGFVKKLTVIDVLLLVIVVCLVLYIILIR